MRVDWSSALAALALCVSIGCSERSTPETSSSSHWFKCSMDDDCAEAAGAVGCSAGYCVDTEGRRIAITQVRLPDASLPDEEEPDAADTADASAHATSPARDTGTPDTGTPNEAGTFTIEDEGTIEPGDVTLRVLVRDTEGARADVPVALHDEGGSVIITRASDVAGEFVTARAVSALSYRLGASGPYETIVGVEQGDVIPLGVYSLREPSASAPLPPIPITLTDLPASTTTTQVLSVRAGCRAGGVGAGTVLSLEGYEACTDSSNILLASALNGSEPLAFSWLDDVVLAGPDAVAALSFGQWQPPARVRVNLLNAPVNGFGSAVWMLRGGRGIDASSAAEVHSYFYASNFSEELAVRANVDGHTKLVRVAPADIVTVAFDQNMPLATVARLERAADGSLHVRWTRDGAPENADLVQVKIALTASPAGSCSSFCDWTISAPPDTTDLRLPELPFGLGAVELTATRLNSVNYVASSALTDYAAYRARQRLPRDGRIEYDQLDGPGSIETTLGR